MEIKRDGQKCPQHLPPLRKNGKRKNVSLSIFVSHGFIKIILYFISVRNFIFSGGQTKLLFFTSLSIGTVQLKVFRFKTTVFCSAQKISLNTFQTETGRCFIKETLHEERKTLFVYLRQRLNT